MLMSSEPGAAGTPSETDLVLREVLRDVLGLPAARTEAFTADTGLFGHLPELDSMAVAGLLTEIEDRLDIVVEDDEVDGEMLETYGGLLRFVTEKRQAAMSGSSPAA
jgi:acyl carrier protein